jgi:hypothetical protein
MTTTTLMVVVLSLLFRLFSIVMTPTIKYRR